MRTSLVLSVCLVVACGDDSSSSDAGESDSAIDVGFDGGPPEDCDTPGAVEDVPCGRCGTIERFCSAEGEWVFMGECTDEGVCDPGTTEDVACGMCGMQTSRCTDTCEWEATGACMNETGECTPGETQTTSDGCSGDDVRELTCNATCAFDETLECGPPPGVDVMFLLHSRGWGGGLSVPLALRSIESAAMRMLDNFYEPVTDLRGDVAVGVAGYTDFPVEPYGEAGDQPAYLLQEPTTQPLDAATATLDLDWDGGGDIPASGIEALQALASTPHTSVPASACSAGREGWGCWRPRSERIVVLFADAPHHGAPSAAGPDEPYSGVEATAWSSAAASLRAAGIPVVVLVDVVNQGEFATDLVDQHERMLEELGLVVADHMVVVRDFDTSLTAYRDVVNKIEDLL